jgi:hypothetical protein
MTRPGKIVEQRLAPVLPGDNVLKVKGFKRWQRIREAAIPRWPPKLLHLWPLETPPLDELALM